jgi:hypothetical protein
MKLLLPAFFLTTLLLTIGCKSNPEPPQVNDQADKNFSAFEDRFLDAYWKQHPSYAIYAGYGKYYENLIIPDSAGLASTVTFSKAWLDSLNTIDLNNLSDNNKISPPDHQKSTRK